MIAIQTEEFNVAEEYRILSESAKNSGAIVTFVGRVRDYGDQSGVESITLEHYPAMTQKSLQKIVESAQRKWSIQQVRIVHRVGELFAGEQIVFVGIASSHRADAFAACEYIMDLLKTQAPFWKKEKNAQGQQWVAQKEGDTERAKRWQEN